MTRRQWADNYHGPNVGTVVPAVTDFMTPKPEADCFIRITDRYEQPLGEMTDEDAQAEGDYETVAEFRASYREIYGDWDPERVVEVIEFDYVGDSPPTNADG